MGIQPTSAYTVPSVRVNPPLRQNISAGETASVAALAASIADRATISQAARDRAAEAPTSGATYDFTNISPNDILPTINSLIQSGHMSLDESSHLLLLVPISLEGGSSPTTLKQGMNLFSALENWMAFHKSIHNDAAVIYAEKALSALRRIQASHRTEG